MLHPILSGVSGCLSLLYGLAVFFKSRGSMERKVFAGFCISVFVWLFGYALMEGADNPDSALFFARIGHAGVIFVPTLWMHFTRYAVRVPRLVPFYRLYYLVDLIFLYMLFGTNFFMPGMVKHWWGFYPIGSPIMLAEAALLVTVAVSCWGLFLKECRKAKLTGSPEYNKLKYCCISLTAFSFGAVDYLPKFGIQIYPVGFLSSAIFLSVVTYAILMHRLMNIRVVIRRGLVYSVLVAITASIYFAFVLVAERLLQGVVGYRSLIGSVLAGFAIALGFNPLKDLVQQFIDRMFFHGSQEALAEENERLRHEITRTERLKSVATLAAGMAHEIKNPLAAIKTFAEYMPDKFADPAYREKYSKIMAQEVEKMNALVHRLLEFARPGAPRLQRVEPAALLRETLEFLQGTLVEKQVQVDLALTSHAAVQGDPGQLKQVFLNLLLNSIDAIDPPGQLLVSTYQENGHVRVTITDTGCGIAKADLPRIFDPFFTRKSGGTGLGLSVVHSIVQEHGGRINVDSVLGIGTTIHISLPTYGGSNGATAHPDR